MKLRYSTTSPFVRKVTVLAHEAKKSNALELVPTVPSDPASGLPAENPLRQIPALILESGESLYDSRVICAYLDELWGTGLYPKAGDARWRCLRLEALADGVLDAAVLIVMEGRRAEPYRSSEWIQRQELKILGALEVFEQELAHTLSGKVTMGQLTMAIALGYLDFRLPKLDWRGRHAGLRAWYESFAKRESLNATLPRDA